ncbi:MAG: hypothetical protein HY328_10615 [Chloroflexi bacterium]|nr:hypothetical protein [Chloroflexota bacterium]
MSSKVHERLSDILRWSGQIPQFVLALYALQGRVSATRSLLPILIAAAITLGFAGSSAPNDHQARFQAIGVVVAGRGFSLGGWEWQALGEKARAWFDRTGAGLTVEQERALVFGYFDGVAEVRRLEDRVNRLVSASNEAASNESLAQAREQLAALRAQQQQRRPLVEAVIQRQVAELLAEAGMGIAGTPAPPVNFTFTEPPQILIISPRQEIRNVYAQMLAPDIDSAEAHDKEAAIVEQTNLSAYITKIGGMAAYPTMVIDRGSLTWVFSTVAHEWVHNYLTLFPLGMRFGSSPELTTLNETVADIIGDEVGRRVLARYYPELLPPEERIQKPEEQPDEPLLEPGRPRPFDFNREMRETRLRVDELLASGHYETAEQYMEARRRFFVANGYHLRVLNQAYFAFHGSYATGGASSSPIGPQLQELQRIKTPEDIAGFLHTVRWFTSAADLERALCGMQNGE